MKWDVINRQGEKVRQIELDDAIFQKDMNEHVLHLVTKAYRANRRQGTHATKTRSLVSGGGKKPFKQKGTGEARQGSSRSPLMPGGGTAHGPQPRDYTQDVNVKTKQLALKIALSDKVRHNKLVVLDQFGVDKYSTKNVIELLGHVAKETCKKVLVHSEAADHLWRSSRNLKGVDTCRMQELNAEHVLKATCLVINEDSLKSLQERLVR